MCRPDHPPAFRAAILLSLVLSNCGKSSSSPLAAKDGGTSQGGSDASSTTTTTLPVGGAIGAGGAGGFGGTYTTITTVPMGGAGGAFSSGGTGGTFASGGVGAGGIGFGGSGGVVVPTTGKIGADGLLDGAAALDIVVASDEHHVAYLRDYVKPSSSCTSGGEAFYARANQIGMLVVATLASDGAVISRVVAQSVKATSVHFSADSQSLVYVDNYEPCLQGGRLQAAASDGTNPRTVDSLGVYFDLSTVGNTLLYGLTETNGINDKVVALHLPDGAPVVIPNTFNTWIGSLPVSPDGRWIGTFDDKKVLTIVDVNGASSHPIDLGPQAGSFDTIQWSPDGKFMALKGTNPGTNIGGLALAPADATQVKTLVASNWIVGAAFSPDSQYLAYGAPGAAGAFDLVVHPLAGGTDRHLANYPDPTGNNGVVTFSADGGLVMVASMPMHISATGTALYAASTLGDGPLRFVTTGVNGAPVAPSGDNYVAATLDSDYTMVFPLSGGDANVLPGIGPVYQPRSAQPRLLLSPRAQGTTANSVPVFLLASTDGSNSKTVTLPTGAFQWGPSPRWIGMSVVYGYADSSGLTGIYALAADGTNATPLAAGPDTYGWAAIPTPTRLFYARKAANGAGPAGLWTTTFP